jgi:NDP-sugar pyrophosphorylase family protein
MPGLIHRTRDLKPEPSSEQPAGTAARLAIVLCGGLGSRLRGEFDDRPKPMAPVDGRPFLEWVLRWLAGEGTRRVVLATGHMSGQIRDHFGDGTALGLEIAYTVEERLLGTGGAVRQAAEVAGGDRFFVTNGDSFCAANLDRLEADHLAKRARATIWAIPAEDRAQAGAIQVDAGGRVTAFQEKARGAGGGLVNAGVYLIERDVVKTIPAGTPASLERDVFPGLVGGGLYAVEGGGPLVDIGTPDSYRSAAALLSQELARLAAS